MAQYWLQSTLVGHTGDVKAVAFAPMGVVSASRDGTARALEAGSVLVETDVFLNAVASTPQSVFVGGQDGSIISVDISSGVQTFYIGHTANVCALSADASRLLSGSWDNTARVWDTQDPAAPLIVLEGHTQAVWAVLILGPGDFLTGSADKTIIRWMGGTRAQTFRGHTDAVRGLCRVGANLFASCSNDGTVKIWSLSDAASSVDTATATLHGSNSFLYSVAYDQKTGTVFASGEDRSVRLWQKEKLIQTITLPAISLWSIAVAEDGTLAVGSSDHKVRLFTPHKDKRASASELRTFEEEVAASSLGEDQTGRIDESQLSDESVLQRPGKEGQVVMVKSRGVIEAHQFTTGQWFKVGQVMGSTSDGSKTNYNGRDYDFVFDVDVQEGAPPLKLPFDKSDNVYTAAQNFVSEHSLSPTYVEDVVRFLIANTQGVHLDSSAPTQETPRPAPLTSEPQAVTTDAGVLSFSTPHKMISYRKEPLVKAFLQTAQKHGEAPAIEAILDSLPGASSELLTLSLSSASQWGIDGMLPALDTLRLAIPDAPKVPIAPVIALLLSCIEPPYPKHSLLACRGLVNLSARPDAAKIISSNTDAFAQALELVSQFSTLSTPLALAVATLLLNLAIGNFQGALAPLAIWLTTKTTDREAVYRLGLAVGIRANKQQEVGQLSKLKSWFRSASDDDRFKELATKVVSLLD